MNNVNNKFKSVSFGLHIAIAVFWVLAIFGVFFAFPRLGSGRQERVINVLTWGGLFDAGILSDFYKKTGIRVNVNFYTTNEELLIHLKATGGQGYDLIIPSDYAVNIIREQNLIKKLDFSKLSFLKSLNPLLMGHGFDPLNEYALPYMWEVFGFGYDKNRFKKNMDNVGWDMVFKSSCDFKIGMINDSIEAVVFAAYYLYGVACFQGNLTCAQQKEVRNLLIRQKGRVEAYTDSRPDYLLLTKNCPLVVASSTSILRGIEQSSDIGFTIPGQHAFISIEHVAIPATCTCDDLVYEFINYIYRPDVIKHHFRMFASLPPVTDLLSEIALPKALGELLVLSYSEFKKRVLFFAPLVSENQLNDLWIDVKSH